MVVITCPACGAVGQIQDSFRGHFCLCHQCHQPVKVTDAMDKATNAKAGAFLRPPQQPVVLPGKSAEAARKVHSPAGEPSIPKVIALKNGRVQPATSQVIQREGEQRLNIPGLGESAKILDSLKKAVFPTVVTCCIFTTAGGIAGLIFSGEPAVLSWAAPFFCVGIIVGTIGGFLGAYREKPLWPTVATTTFVFFLGALVAGGVGLAFLAHGFFACYLTQSIHVPVAGQLALSFVYGAIGGLPFGLIFFHLSYHKEVKSEQGKKLNDSEYNPILWVQNDPITSTFFLSNLGYWFIFWLYVLVYFLFWGTVELLVELLKIREGRLTIAFWVILGSLNCFIFFLVQYLGVEDIAFKVGACFLFLIPLGFAVFFAWQRDPDTSLTTTTANGQPLSQGGQNAIPKEQSLPDQTKNIFLIGSIAGLFLGAMLVGSLLLLLVMWFGGWPKDGRDRGVITNNQTSKDILMLDLGGGVNLKLVRINPGTFMMGSPANEGNRENDEMQHEVEITRPYYMGIYTVTQAQYHQVMKENPSAFREQGEGKDKVVGLNTENFPVETVNWKDAMKFCRLVSEMPEVKARGLVVDLPTEAEWEYACRAGKKTAFHYGNVLSSKQANFYGENPYGEAEKGPNLGRTSRVGSYYPNAWGLFDMHGNVWQWCKDWYKKNNYQNSDKRDPQKPNNSITRVLRGGSWISNGMYCRSACRHKLDPGDSLSIGGFRVVVRLSPRTP